MCREFARARRRGNDSYPFVLWDANIRVACDVERFYELHPIARGLSPEGLCDVLMSDDLLIAGARRTAHTRTVPRTYISPIHIRPCAWWDGILALMLAVSNMSHTNWSGD